MISAGAMARELALVTRMLETACAVRHGTSGGALCSACTELRDYVQARLARCSYGDDKPTCRQCPIHCYRPEARARIKDVMRIAGPRLLLRGDMDALRHLMQDAKPAPPREKAGE